MMRMARHIALKDARGLAAGETLLVLGAAGGVGLAAVEIGFGDGHRRGVDRRQARPLPGPRRTRRSTTTGEDLKERIRALTDGVASTCAPDPVGGPYAAPAL
jgi:NADPH2:quinone reductase